MKIVANKTKVVNSINVWDENLKNNDVVKEILNIKKCLKQRTVKDHLDSITHYYNRLIEMYCINSKDNNWQLIEILKGVVKEILKSNIEIESYNMSYINDLKRYNLI